MSTAIYYLLCAALGAFSVLALNLSFGNWRYWALLAIVFGMQIAGGAT